MKSLLSFLLLFFIHVSYAQSLQIDSTRFITGNKCCVDNKFACPTSDGGILFVGTEGGGAGGIVPLFPDISRRNVLVGKMDVNKQISWIKVFGGTETDFGVSACQTPDGGYAVLSTVRSLDIDITDHKGVNDLWLIRLDHGGNVLWKKSYGSSYSDVAVSVASTADSGFILFGNTNGSDGDVPFHYGGYFDLDWLVIKIDGSGNVQWSKNLGSTADEYIGGAILAIDDAYYLVGASAGKDHDCTDTAWHSGVATPYDIYVLKLDAAGNVLWNRSYGGSGGEAAYHAIYDTRDSTIMIAGGSGSSDYMVTANYGQEDMWVLKVDLNGTLLWQKSFGTANSEGATSICSSVNSGYLVYGGVSGTIGSGDQWLIMTDKNGGEVAHKIFGGIAAEQPHSIVPFRNGYAAVGLSHSIGFTEGVNYGRTMNDPTTYISFIDYWPVSLNALKDGSNHLTIIPNPVNSLLRISLATNLGSGTLKVVNSVGSCIYNVKYNQVKNIELDTYNWPAGIYMVQWHDEGGKIYYERLSKQ